MEPIRFNRNTFRLPQERNERPFHSNVPVRVASRCIYISHDRKCVEYPDTVHLPQEICFLYHEEDVAVVEELY